MKNKNDIIIAAAESHGFKYNIRLETNSKGTISFVVTDKIFLNGVLVESEIVYGDVDEFGRCEFSVKCDMFAALGLGEIMKRVIESASEFDLKGIHGA